MSCACSSQVLTLNEPINPLADLIFDGFGPLINTFSKFVKVAGPGIDMPFLKAQVTCPSRNTRNINLEFVYLRKKGAHRFLAFTDVKVLLEKYAISYLVYWIRKLKLHLVGPFIFFAHLFPAFYREYMVHFDRHILRLFGAKGDLRVLPTDSVQSVPEPKRNPICRDLFSNRRVESFEVSFCISYELIAGVV